MVSAALPEQTMAALVCALERIAGASRKVPLVHGAELSWSEKMAEARVRQRVRVVVVELTAG
jgi:hypothetical protein